MYNMTLKFESTIFVKAFNKDFENMLSSIGGSVNHYGQTAKLEHTINIANSPVLPNDEIIEIFKKNISEALTETFNNQKSLNAEVRNVEFIGIIKIENVN